MKHKIKKDRAESVRMNRIQTAIAMGIMNHKSNNPNNLNQVIFKTEMTEPKNAIQAAFEKLFSK